MEMSDQLKALSQFYHRHTLNKRLGETHSRGESSVDEINLLSLQESNHNSPVVRPAFTIQSALYCGADMFLARPGRKQASATEDFDVHISYL
jgi:hypothetical protein